MRRQLVAKFVEHGEAEMHNWGDHSRYPTIDQTGANHPFATEAMCLEMTYTGS
jgi:hypothetical protein